MFQHIHYCVPIFVQRCSHRFIVLTSHANPNPQGEMRGTSPLLHLLFTGFHHKPTPNPKAAAWMSKGGSWSVSLNFWHTSYKDYRKYTCYATTTWKTSAVAHISIERTFPNWEEKLACWECWLVLRYVVGNPRNDVFLMARNIERAEYSYEK